MNKHKPYFNQIIFSFLGLLIISCLEFFILQFDYFISLKVTLIIVFTISKVAIITQFALKSIFNNVISGVPYHIYLIYIFVAITLFIASFTSDYYFIYLIDNKSFTGVVTNLGTSGVIFGFLFLSTMFFSMQGVMDLVPNSILAEVYILFESIATYISFIFFLSNFSSLRETLKVLKKN